MWGLVALVSASVPMVRWDQQSRGANSPHTATGRAQIRVAAPGATTSDSRVPSRGEYIVRGASTTDIKHEARLREWSGPHERVRLSSLCHWSCLAAGPCRPVQTQRALSRGEHAVQGDHAPDSEREAQPRGTPGRQETRPSSLSHQVCFATLGGRRTLPQRDRPRMGGRATPHAQYGPHAGT